MKRFWCYAATVVVACSSPVASAEPEPCRLVVVTVYGDTVSLAPDVPPANIAAVDKYWYRGQCDR